MAIESTKDWRTEVVKQFRYPGRVRMVMEVVAEIDKNTVQASAQPSLPLTDVRVTLDGEDNEYEDIATMEGIWRADGTMYLPSRIPSENAQLPLMSDGFVTANNPFVLDYEFVSAVSFVGLSFNWDSVHNAWPTDVEVIGYDATDAQVAQYRITTVTSPVGVLDTPMDNVTAIRIIVYEWSKPALRLRMTEAIFGIFLQLTNSQIMSIEEETKKSLVCDKLPTDTQKYSVRNQIYSEQMAAVYSATINKSHPMTDVSRIFNATAATQGIASVEAHYWKADGSLFLPSRVVEENPNIPWMSETDDFSATDPIDLVITYEKPVQINVVSLTWDTVTNSWPADATVEGRDDYGNVVFSRDIQASGEYTKLTNINSTVKTVHVIIRQWSRIGWRARISQYEAYLAYGNNNIPSEVNNLFDPTLQSGYAKYLARRQKVTVQYGLDTYDKRTLWLPKQVRFLDAWTIPTDAVEVEFNASTRLAFLTQEYVRGTYNPSGATFMQLALEVLRNSNIIRDVTNPEPWLLSEKLATLTTTAPLPKGAENSLLQLIAGATGCVLGTNPIDGYVTITDSVSDSEYVFDSTVQQQSPSVVLDTPLRSIAVKLYNYSIKDSETVLFDGTLTLRGSQTVTIEYEKNACATQQSIVVTGATTSSCTFYGRCAVVNITVPDVDTQVSIKITGHTVESSSAQVTTYFDSTVDSGKDVVIDNPLVTNAETLNAVAACALNYYKKRTSVEFDYLGYPDLKAGDRCGMYSQYFNGIGVVNEHKLTYNGGYKGKIKMVMEG